MNIENSRDYSGKALQGSADLRNNACSIADAAGPELRTTMARIHRDSRARYYGCGTTPPFDAVPAQAITSASCC